MMIDTAGWILEEDRKAEESGEGWEDVVDVAIAGSDLASMVKAYFENEGD